MWTIIKLRLRFLKEDWKLIAVMTLLSLGMVYAMTSSMSGSFARRIYVTDLEQSTISMELQDRIDQLDAYAVEAVAEETARANVKDGKAIAALIIPEGFGQKDGVQPYVISTKNDVEIMNLQNSINAVLRQLRFDQRVDVSAQLLGAPPQQALNDMKASRAGKPAFRLNQTTLESKWDTYDGRIHNFFGFMLLFAAYTIVFSAGEILNDKRFGTWQRLLISPIPVFAVLGGTIVSTFVLGGVQIGAIFLGGQFLYGFDWGGSLALLLLISFLYIFALSGMGLLLASMLKTHAQLSAATPVLLTSFAMLGGCMWPLEIVTSKVLLALSNITPHKWALSALETVTMKGGSIGDVSLNLLVLFLMGASMIAIGSWQVRQARAHT